MNIPLFYRLLTIFRPYIQSLFNLNYYSIVDLQDRVGIDGEKLYIDSFYAKGLYPTSQRGAWRLVYKSSQAKSTHNGITVHSPTVPWDGTQSGLAAYQAKTGETDTSGSGCWVLEINEYFVEMAGAIGDKTTDDSPAFQVLATTLGAMGGGTFRFNGQYLIDTNLSVPDYVTAKGSLEAPDQLKPSTAADYDGKSGGVLVINSAATITLQDSASICNALLIRKGLDLPFSDAVVAAAGTAAFAGTAITGAGEGFYCHHLLILGFNKAATSNGYARGKYEYVFGDCTNGIEIINTGDVFYLDNCHFWPYTTANQTWSSSTLNLRTGTGFSISTLGSWSKFTNNFTYGYATGHSIASCDHVQMVGCGADYPPAIASTSVGFSITGTTRYALLLGIQSTSQGKGVDINVTAGKQTVRVIGAVLRDNDIAHVHVQDGRGIISNCGIDGGLVGVLIEDASDGADVVNNDFDAVPTPISASAAALRRSNIGPNKFIGNADSSVGGRQNFNNSNYAQSEKTAWNASGTGYTLIGTYSRGTEASPTICNSGDVPIRLSGKVYDGADYNLIGRLRLAADGAPSSGSTPGRWLFSTTPSGSTTPTDWLAINSNGQLHPLTNNLNTCGVSSARWANMYTVLLNASGSATAHSGTAIPAGGTAGAGYLFSSTANFGVFFGSGAPTLTAAKGSLYLRSDGSGVGDRMYVNTDGGTTWTSVTTAA